MVLEAIAASRKGIVASLTSPVDLFAVLKGEGALVVAAVADGGRCAVPAAGCGMGEGQPGRYLGSGCNRDAVCICVHLCYSCSEIERVSCADWAPLRR